MRTGWPWLPFVYLSVATALVPGFLLGAGMAAARLLHMPIGAWYGAAAQAHGHAQLLGWGGAMIVGIAFQFLPRVRGAPAKAIRLNPIWFWLFATGLILHIVAQPLAAASGARIWHAAFAAGTWLELTAAIVVLVTLAGGLRQGPPLGNRPGFVELLPALATSASSLLIMLVAGVAGADRTAVDAALLGFVPAISLGMSARLFPLFFRLPAVPRAPLWFATACIAAGVAAITLRALLPAAASALTTTAYLLAAAGLLVGTASVRVFGKRRTFPGDRGEYRWWRDAAAVGVISAYAWAVLAAAALVLSALGQNGSGLVVLPGPISHDLLAHAIGAGFMTLLILGVGPVMLPSFGGGKPPPPLYVWLSVAAGNVSALLRLGPGAVLADTGRYPEWAAIVLPLGGIAGILAVGAFALGLRHSWRPTRREGG